MHVLVSRLYALVKINSLGHGWLFSSFRHKIRRSATVDVREVFFDIENKRLKHNRAAEAADAYSISFKSKFLGKTNCLTLPVGEEFGELGGILCHSLYFKYILRHEGC